MKKSLHGTRVRRLGLPYAILTVFDGVIAASLAMHAASALSGESDVSGPRCLLLIISGRAVIGSEVIGEAGVVVLAVDKQSAQLRQGKPGFTLKPGLSTVPWQVPSASEGGMSSEWSCDTRYESGISPG